MKVTLTNGNKTIAQYIHYFEAPKNLQLEQPDIKTVISSSKPGQVTIQLETNKLVKDLMLTIPNQFTHFSNNYFDLLPGEPAIITLKTNMTTAQVKDQLKLRHLLSK